MLSLDGCDFLSGPLDAVGCLHNAFRVDISQIDALTLNTARNGGNFTAVFDRLRIMGEILDYHAKGEGAAVFPAVDNLTPLVAKAYFMDHRELDIMVNGLEALRNAPDPLAKPSNGSPSFTSSDSFGQRRCSSISNS